MAPVAENAGADLVQRHPATRCLQGWRLQTRLAAKLRFAWQSQGPGASAQCAKSVRNNGCTARIDAPGGSLENIRSRFHCWEFARRFQVQARGCDDNRRAR